jgi:SAM-dependent methyltransferase
MSVPDVNALVGELRARVQQRRDEGAYPDGLERDLEEHFRRITAHRITPDLSAVYARLAELEVKAAFSPRSIPTESQVPGGATLHRTIGRIVARQTQGVLEQMQAFADATKELLKAMVEALETPSHVHADLIGQVDAIEERLSSYERAPAESDVAVRELGRRLARLEEAEAARQFHPTFDNEHFEAEFRGSREQLLAQYDDLAAKFEGIIPPVLDIGCGRGEFLELLAKHGVEARGVEMDAELVDAARQRGLDVTHGDGLAELAATFDESLGGVVLIQVVEHLTPQQAVDLVALCREKVAKGGRVLIETVNPQSLYVFAHSFYLDPTHVRPVHPAYLTFLFNEAGFEATIEWRSPPPEDDVLADDASLTSVERANVERLNRLLYAPQDYALIAIRV